MIGIHVNWTKPFFEKSRLRGHGFKVFREMQTEEYCLPDYQLLITMLSALWWKKTNGKIKLFTDSIGKSYYEKIGISEIYDEIDIETLDNYNRVDPAYFWTSGKIFCLSKQEFPFVFFDQDFVIRNEFKEEIFAGDLTIAHWEIPRGYYYFTEQQFKKEIKHCNFPIGYDTNALVPNTSLLFFRNPELLMTYNSFHEELVDNKSLEVPEWFWLLTDQGILGHAVREGNYRVSTVTNRVYLSDSNHASKDKRNRGYTEPWFQFLDSDPRDKLDWEHLWYIKAVFSEDIHLREQHVAKYKREIKEVFPEYFHLAEKI